MQDKKIHSKSSIETRAFARVFAEQIKDSKNTHATVIALTGDLGAGKTTFVQGFAEAFGVAERVLSPTFVLMKIYQGERGGKHLVHIDCYRLRSSAELIHLGFLDMLRDSDAVFLIEWADMIRDIIPDHAVWITFTHGDAASERIIVLRNTP